MTETSLEPAEVEIRTVEEALAWGDSLVEAYKELWREKERLELRLRDEIFWAEHRAAVHFFTLALLRARMRSAGFHPDDIA